MIVGVIIDVMIRQNNSYESEEMVALEKILRRIDSVEQKFNNITLDVAKKTYPEDDNKESQASIDLENKNE